MKRKQINNQLTNAKLLELENDTNIINDYFRGINTYINYLLNNKEMDVLWI